MFRPPANKDESLVDRLASRGYWPARAAKYLSEGKYSRAVEVCKENLPQAPRLLSGRLIYARALYHAGQTEAAAEQFYRVLSSDPDNMVALKYLGDLKYTDGDEVSAIANYQRVQELDPDGHGLSCSVERPQAETTRTISLSRKGETTPAHRESLRRVYFYTETMGDVYLAQGHARLAAEVYSRLNEQGSNPRLAEKLSMVQDKIRDREK